MKVTGIPFTSGLESFAYLLLADRLLELRPSYKETLGQNVHFDKESAEEARHKSLSDEDVWYSHMELNDDQTITMYFIVLTFDVREKMKDYADGGIKSKQASRYESVRGGPRFDPTEERAPWYGSKRYDIVEHVLKMQEAKEAAGYRSAVQEAALKAQKPFLTMSMKDVQKNGEYSGPPKYLNQRDAPLEIPADIIKSFFRSCDQDCDDRITLEELISYSVRHRLPLEKEIIEEMFLEIIKQRVPIHESKRDGPLLLEEI